MGSGCNSSRVSRCVTITPDTCVKYTGPAITSLGICNGDMLDEVEAVIINKIVDYATGAGITISDLDFTQCDFLEGFISCCAQDNSLKGIFQLILKALCAADAKITDVQDDITDIQAAINYTVDAGCLTVTNTRIDTVLNKLINDYCDFKDAVTNIFGNLTNPVINNTVVTQVTDTVINTVFNNIQGCSPTDVIKTGSGINTVITIKGQAPIGAFMFGIWDASYFDNTGMGLPSKGMCGWAAADGNNGRPDLRGFGLAMATNIPSGIPLDTVVDPVGNNDADYGTNIGDKKGKVKYKLTLPETPIHTHTVTIPPHTHTIPIGGSLGQSGNTGSGYTSPVNNSPNGNITTTQATLTPTVSSVGGDLPHETRQPTKYYYCIIRVD